jgi:hypothetical protein
MLILKALRSLCRYAWHSQRHNGSMRWYVTPYFTRNGRHITEVRADNRLWPSVTKVWPSAYKFSGNPQMSHSIHFREHSCIEFYPDRTKIQKIEQNLIYAIKKNGCRWADFHETHKFSMVLRWDTLYRISPKSIKKYETYGQKFIYALKWSRIH